MIKFMDMENHIIKVNYRLKENIYIIIEEKVNFMSMEFWNMKVNIYIIKNGMEKDMMKMVI